MNKHVRANRSFVKLCFQRLDDCETWGELEARTGLTIPTLRKLWFDGPSRWTHALTLEKLGEAAGLKHRQHLHKFRVVG